MIPDKPDIERDAVADVWSVTGSDVLRLGRFWDPPALDLQRVRLYGGDSYCQVLAQKLGLMLMSPPDDWLLQLARLSPSGRCAEQPFPRQRPWRFPCSSRRSYRS